MTVTAKLHHIRIPPRKVRLVANLIRGKKAEEAQTILNFTVKKAARPLLKLLKSAVANAKHNFQAPDESNLFIAKIIVDEGSKLKRWRARARGVAGRIQKKTSHVTLVLGEITPGTQREKKIRTKKTKTASIPSGREMVEKAPKVKKGRFKREIITERVKMARGIKKIFKRKAF
jgi:large subunit ribosomal protein L22